MLYLKLKQEIFSSVIIPGNPLITGSVNITGLQSFTNYTFQVAAVNENQLIGMYSNSVMALTLETGIYIICFPSTILLIF